jgi:hypothetical protein
MQVLDMRNGFVHSEKESHYNEGMTSTVLPFRASKPHILTDSIKLIKYPQTTLMNV